MRQDREPTGLLCRWVETSNTSLNGTGALCVAALTSTPPASPDQWPRAVQGQLHEEKLAQIITNGYMGTAVLAGGAAFAGSVLFFHNIIAS